MHDSELVRQAQGGDRDAFRALVLAHQSSVRAVLRRMTGGDQARADDLAQEVFLAAFRGLSGFRKDASFATWIYRIAYRCFIDDQRKRKDPPAASEEFPELAAAPPADSDLERRESLQQALLQLSSEQRMAVLLTSLEEFTQEEAARSMDIPLGTLKTHVLRGKEKLRMILQAKGWEATSL